jgi:glycosyltransferase involved in cell wall biosynthesis
MQASHFQSAHLKTESSASQLKFLFVLGRYMNKDFMAGGERFNFNLINELKGRGHKIDLALLNKDHTPFNCPNIGQVFYLKEPQEANLAEILQKNQYDYVISEKAQFSQADLLYLHGHSYPYHNRAYHNAWFGILRDFIDKLPFLRSKKMKEFLRIKQSLQKSKSTILVPSTIMQEDTIKNFEIAPARVKIAHPPLSIDFKPNTMQAQTNSNQVSRLEKQNHNYIFGLVAMGFHIKGGYLTLKALKSLKNKSKQNWQLKIICKFSSSSLWLIRSLVYLYGLQDFVKLLPSQPNIGDFYQSLDCLIIPSLQESFGMVAMEAMAYGVPVIASSVCGCTDIINKQNGFIFPTQSAKALAEKMQRFMELSASQKVQMSVKAKTTVKDLNWANFIAEFLAILVEK